MADDRSLLLDVWKQTRTDLDSAQENFRKTVSFFLAASFGLSAFLLSKDGPMQADAFWAATGDLMFIAVFSAMMVRYLRSITLARAAVEWYERKLKASLEAGWALLPTDLFPRVSLTTRMKLSNDSITGALAILVVLIKAIWLFVVHVKNGHAAV